MSLNIKVKVLRKMILLYTIPLNFRENSRNKKTTYRYIYSSSSYLNLVLF